MSAYDANTKLASAKTQLRILQILLSLTMLFTAFEPAISILYVPESMLRRVANLSGDSVSVAQMLLVSGLLIVPHAITQICCPHISARRAIAKAACLGLVGVSLSYILMAWLSHNIDVPALTSTLTRQSVGPLGYALALALSLNADLAQKILEVKV